MVVLILLLLHFFHLIFLTMCINKMYIYPLSRLFTIRDFVIRHLRFTVRESFKFMNSVKCSFMNTLFVIRGLQQFTNDLPSIALKSNQIKRSKDMNYINCEIINKNTLVSSFVHIHYDLRIVLKCLYNVC